MENPKIPRIVLVMAALLWRTASGLLPATADAAGSQKLVVVTTMTVLADLIQPLGRNVHHGSVGFTCLSLRRSAY